MYLKEDEAKKVIELLKHIVSGFSHTIHQEGVHGDGIICGGIVKTVVRSSDWTDQDDIVYVTLDDALGSILIVVPTQLWKGIEVNDIVAAEGVLFSLKKECNFVSKAGGEITVVQPNEPLRVLVKKITKLN